MDKLKVAYSETIKLWQNTDDPDYSQKLNSIITQLKDVIQEADYTAKKQSECHYCHTYRKISLSPELCLMIYLTILLVTMDSDLISVVNELGDRADTIFSDLEVVEIPEDAEYEITDYDGIETVHWGYQMGTA